MSIGIDKKLLGTREEDIKMLQDMELAEQDEKVYSETPSLRDPFDPKGRSENINDLSEIKEGISLQETNKEAESPFQKSKEDQYVDIMQKMQKVLDRKTPKNNTADVIEDSLAKLYNLTTVLNPTGVKQMKVPGAVERSRKSFEDKQAKDLTGLEMNRKMLKDLMDMQKSKSTKNVYQTKSGLVQLDDEGKPVEIYKDPLAQLYANTRETDLTLREKKFEENKNQKYQEDARKAMEDMRKTETWKDAERIKSEIPGLKMLIVDAYEKGGQSVAMLGPKIAKGLAGEKGVLTDKDVTRYVQNPALAKSISATLKKATQGKLTEDDRNNLMRLAEISEKIAQNKMQEAVNREVINFSRREKLPLDDARRLLDINYQETEEEAKLKKQSSTKSESKLKIGDKTYKVGSIVKVKGKLYKIINDKGDLKEVK